MPAQHYDVVIVGGGINGVAVAQAAAAAGHSVLLLEKNELAAGTSHASSKLIHGGLRYLESFEFKLVFEALRERKLMLRNAPELVKLQAFYIPVYQHTRRPPWLIALGLGLYALLNGLQKSSRFRWLPKSEWQTLDGIQTENLRAVLQYWDAQTDDRLLTEAIMQSAQALGAELQTQARFITATRQNRQTTVMFERDGRRLSCNAHVIVNAGGPWANAISHTMQPRPKLLDVDLIQGTHIILRGSLSERFYYVESPRDGRAVFLMPWYGNTLVGTTEARFTGKPDEIAPLQSSERYLLGIVKYYFPDFQAEMIDSFAGARVLPSAKSSAFKRSRETILQWQPENDPLGIPVCTIYGGKLTAWRSTAEKVMTVIGDALPKRQRRISTCDIVLQRPDLQA